MHVESVRAAVPVEREDGCQVRDLATELQVHKVKPAEKSEEEDAFEHGRSPEEGKLVWLGEEKRAVYRVIEAETGEILQQVPSDEVIRVSRNIEEFLISDDRERGIQA